MTTRLRSPPEWSPLAPSADFLAWKAEGAELQRQYAEKRKRWNAEHPHRAIEDFRDDD
jgi:hypothetical protein